MLDNWRVSPHDIPMVLITRGYNNLTICRHGCPVRPKGLATLRGRGFCGGAEARGEAARELTAHLADSPFRYQVQWGTICAHTHIYIYIFVCVYSVCI